MGNIVTIQGKPKSRKTVFITALLASFVSGLPVLGMDCARPNDAKIAWIDTEQSHYDLYKCVSFVKSAAGVKVLPSFIQIYQNRPLSPSENRAFLITLLKDTSINIVFIDGLLDFVNDMNNIEEVAGLIQELQQIIFEKNILLITVLHENKGSNFSLGHLGSFLERKSQSVLRVEKNAAGSTLEPVYLRSDQDFSPIQIFWNFEKMKYEARENHFKTNIKRADELTPADLSGFTEFVFSEYNHVPVDVFESIIKSKFEGAGRGFVKAMILRLKSGYIKELNGLFYKF